ncbi:MAG: GNAT family N-acetyltransferase [Pyrinomonadaceae bacterium]
MAAVLTNKGTHARTRHAEVETARLRLRPFTLEDLDGLWRIARDPEVMRHIGDGLPFTRDETLANLSKIVEVFEQRGYGRWALEKKDGGGLIGYCGLGNSVEEVGVEVVYLLAREEWGKGIATEAGSAALRYGFETLGCDSIAALTRPDNWRSRRVMERLGMSFERDACYHGYTCVCYRLARQDWHAPGGAIYRVR